MLNVRSFLLIVEVVRWAKVSKFYDMQVGRVRNLDLLNLNAFVEL